MESRRIHPAARATGRRALAALAAAVVALAGCGASKGTASTGSAASSVVVGRLGSLEVLHAFLPDPPSPSVAAVYLTVRNSGATADALVSVSSPAASSSMLMTESGGAVGTMTHLAALVIPAHGEATLTPGHDHVMLEEPRAGMKVGQHVEVTLRFQRAGRLTIDVPVVPLSAIVGDDGAASGSGSGSMAGMNMGGQG